MTELMAGQYNALGPPTATANTDLPIQVDAQGRTLISGAGVAGTPAGGVASVQGVTGGTPIAVSITDAAGSITWGAITAVAQTGASKVLIAANPGRKGIIFWNPAGNAVGAFDLSGGTVSLAAGIPLYAGGSPTVITSPEVPVGAITAIGTNTQNFYYSEGT